MPVLIPSAGGIPLGLTARKTLYITSGNILTRFVFRVRRGNGAFGSDQKITYQDCYTFVTSTNPDTPAQQTQRSKCAAGTLAWQNLSEDQKQNYRDLAVGSKFATGFTFFMSEYLFSH